MHTKQECMRAGVYMCRLLHVGGMRFHCVKFKCTRTAHTRKRTFTTIYIHMYMHVYTHTSTKYVCVGGEMQAYKSL